MSIPAPNPHFSERVSQMVDELSLAIHWDSACILLGVYRSEYIKDKVALSIKQSIEKQGQSVNVIRVSRIDHDILLTLKEIPSHKGIIHYITGFNWGGGKNASKAFLALNMHREYLVEFKMRCIFWITQTELKRLTRYAPDFWAFRHKVVDFPDLPSPEEIPSGITKGISDYEEKILQLLNRLKLNPKDIDTRKELAELFNWMGCYEEAIQHYKKLIRFAGNRTDFLLPLATIYRNLGQEALARQLQHRADRNTQNI